MTLSEKNSPILAPGENCWRAEKAEKVSFLVDAASYFQAFREAVKLARKTIFICGWDIDSRLELLREEPGDDYPLQLGDFLNEVAGRKSGLQIYILIWDFAMIIGMERQWFPIYSFDWKTHHNIHFAMDDLHPVGASQHQKIVVIDDSLAFVGGLDLTKNRWDTPTHDPHDEKRKTFAGKAYRPHHDVQMLVSGKTATHLGEFFRWRWQEVTGHTLDIEQNSDIPDIWPDTPEPAIFNCCVGIARTIAEYNNLSAVREVEKLYLDSFEKARSYIYIENQYLTAPKIFKAMAASLRQKNGPEIIIVLPEATDGWLSQYTMDVLRKRAVHEMRQADKNNRLGVFYAYHEGLDKDNSIKIHAKIMIVDDVFVRVGSSNLNNRSMGLDTECDLALETEGEPEQKKAVALFCHKLLAEHLGADVDTIEETLDDTGSLLQTIRKLQGRKRTLKDLEFQLDEADELVAEEQYLLDPEKPIEPERLIEHWLPLEKMQQVGFNRVGLFLLVLLCVGLALAWRFTPLNEMITGDQFSHMVEYLKTSDLAWLYVSAAYVFGSILIVPITVLITLTILIYGSLKGFLFAILGASVSGAITYGLGRSLGRKTVRQLAGDRVNRVSKRLGKSGIFSTFIVRLMPIAPYSIVNIIAGASHIRFLDFMMGTVLGLLPGILAIAGLLDRGFALFNNPDLVSIISLIAVIAVIIGAYIFMQRKLQEQE